MKWTGQLTAILNTPADIVTLDRVIFCYPDVEKLVESSVVKAKHVYGLVYPRERWLIDEEFTVKRLYQQGKSIRLLAENPAYPPIDFTDGQELRIWGSGHL